MTSVQFKCPRLGVAKSRSWDRQWNNSFSWEKGREATLVEIPLQVVPHTRLLYSCSWREHAYLSSPWFLSNYGSR